ncbi:mitochondrial ATP synthase g subunit-domain-containing protein [Gloeopeniophorella convolvens]|nr:mitochondrial ATP synthase g subunit-domain-containing protein [Gloeopeniophorella convolvens]
MLRVSALRSALRTTAPRRGAATSTPPPSPLAEAQKKAQDLLSAVGGRLSGLLGSYQQPVRYNLSVAREVFKHIYTAERLQPPRSLDAVRSAYSTLFARGSSVTFWREAVRSGEWARIGVYAVEAYGVFKIGEIVGRRSLVGYNVQ